MVFAESVFMIIHFRILGTPDAGGESQGIEICLGIQHGLFIRMPVQVHVRQPGFRSGERTFSDLREGGSVKIQVLQYAGAGKSFVSDAFQAGREVYFAEGRTAEGLFTD